MAIEDLQAYLISKGKDAAAAGDTAMAKSWLLTCGVLFPSSLDLQFSRYRLFKKEGNVDQTVKYLTIMLENPTRTPYVKKEVEDMVSNVVSSKESFDSLVFSRLSPSLQYKTLMSVVREVDDLDLYLFTLQMFPSKVEEEAVHLTKVVKDPRTLFFQVLPLTLQSKAVEDKDVLLGHLKGLYKFFIDNSYISSDSPNEDVTQLEKKMNEVVSLIAKKLNWRRELFDYSGDRDLELMAQKVSSFSSSPRIKTEEDHPMDLSASKRKKLSLNQESVFAVVLLMLKSLNVYRRLESKTALIELPSSSIRSSTPEIVVSSEEHLPLKTSFSAMVICLEFMHDRDFLAVLKDIRLESYPAFLHFCKESSLYFGKYRDFLTQSIALDTEKKLKPVLQTISASLMMADRKSCLTYCVIACELLSKEESSEELVENVIQDDCKNHRTLTFLSLKYSRIVDFVVSCIILCLKDVPGDSCVGDLIVLCQYQWPKHVSTFKSCLTLVNQTKRFVYLDFASHVFHPEILEELMFLSKEINMELKPVTSSKSMTTRGVNKNVKEEVKTVIRDQMNKSVVLKEQNFIDFIRKMKY